jgi:hypothetical protein
LTAFICFWSAGISVAIYLLLLPLYMLPGQFERQKVAAAERSAGIANERGSHQVTDA